MYDIAKTERSGALQKLDDFVLIFWKGTTISLKSMVKDKFKQ